ncbi:hypothetical protein AGABI2DRAFT_134979 [Agaricus bisporus var. bisporus H97]|uniref:hypothetical protein n=1 Tax=Agaricus bisporus var. bisporus (strain H97 / ATCC MYA-4626 / FGSC 10389) TaxID=936046 RepID=UPI00029F7A04|nr:hypothetical protein AGABI2DRAFT_134979 [Agaricus bisporus var. bisporus H97]EKV49512.1 hypothetical protein AGABI2DRAFT_134979 [Agaricus bisporus var. bisporus H97]
MARHQIAETQAIVTAPEQLDIITRQSTDISAHGLVLGYRFLDHPAHGNTNEFRHLVGL